MLSLYVAHAETSVRQPRIDVTVFQRSGRSGNNAKGDASYVAGLSDGPTGCEKRL